MCLSTKTAVIKSDLQQILLLLLCFSAYLINKCNVFILYSLYAQIKLLVL